MRGPHSEKEGLTMSNRTILGVQANGMAAISEIVIRPSANPVTVVRFQISLGQILSFPLTEDGYIEASSRKEPVLSYTHEEQPLLQCLRNYEDSVSSHPLRIDVEPCWEEDHRYIVFRVRQNGIAIASLNINTVLSRLEKALQTAVCQCEEMASEVIIPSKEKWRSLSISMLTSSKSSLLLEQIGRRKEIKNGERYLIDTNGSEVALLFALGIIECRQMAVSKACIQCAYRKVKEKSRVESTVIILASLNDAPTVEE